MNGSAAPRTAPASILVVRTSALGDIVHSLPVLSALRRAFPSARIAWVVEEAFADVLTGHPQLDEVIPVKLREWRHRPARRATLRDIGVFLSRLRRFRADVALDLMGNHKGGILAFASGAECRLGAARRDRREPSSAIWINRPVATPGEHAVDRARALLAGLGLAAEPADFGADRLLPGAVPRTPAPSPYLVILPGAGWANKRYPPAAWGEVASRIVAGGGPPSRIVPGPGEEALAAEIAAASGGAGAAEDVAELAALAARVRGARLVLGGDSGPLHLAHALGAPVLCLMGPTDPRRHGPYGAPERALWRQLPCSFCYRRLDETKACLLEIRPREVAERALTLLAGGAT